MKNLNKLWSLMLSLIVVMAMVSCDEDDVAGPGDGGDEGLLLADGFYLAKDGEDPISDNQIKAANVDAPSFSAMARVGFMQGTMYLTTGSYTLVEVKDKVIVSTIGGAVTDVTEVHNEECDESGYSLVAATVDGAAFAVAAEGLYVVAYDTDLAEIVYDQYETVGIIGGATPGGWSTDTQMTGTVTAEGGSWSVEGVDMEENEWKIRFNCRWGIDRRLDTTVDFDNANGYSFFTNYGGSVDNLVPGNEGSNMVIAERGVYTITFSWLPGGSVVATTERTGDLEPLPEWPEAMYMIGGSIGGWDWAANGVQMIPVHSNPHLFWRIIWIENGAADPGFKFAPAAEWGSDFGVTGDATDGVYAQGGDNVGEPAESAYFMVVVNMDTETIEVNTPTVYGIGDAFGNDDTQWESANENQIFTIDKVNGVISSPAFIADDKAVRIHVTATTLNQFESTDAVDWWQAELMVLEGMIEYRGTGDDQTVVSSTTGHKVNLNFKDGTGTIK
ncbi:MAG: SusF/SusE family outer membrane protein [Reichenbachiella sp.]